MSSVWFMVTNENIDYSESTVILFLNPSTGYNWFYSFVMYVLSLSDIEVFAAGTGFIMYMLDAVQSITGWHLWKTLDYKLK